MKQNLTQDEEEKQAPLEKECAVCFNFMVEPIKLPNCSHRFCIQCIQEIFRKDETKECPMCRTKMPPQMSTDASMIDQEYAKQLLQFYPQEFEARKQILQEAGDLASEQMDLEFEVGNHYKMLTHSEIEENDIGLMLLHRWTAYIRIRDPKRAASIDKIIAHVDFTLCDGTVERVLPCKIDKKSLSPDKGKNEVSITRKAFDTFPLNMVIYFTKACGRQQPYKYTHNLCFDRMMTRYHVKIQFAHQKLEPLILTPHELKKIQSDRNKQTMYELIPCIRNFMIRNFQRSSSFGESVDEEKSSQQIDAPKVMISKK